MFLAKAIGCGTGVSVAVYYAYHNCVQAANVRKKIDVRRAYRKLEACCAGQKIDCGSWQ